MGEQIPFPLSEQEHASFENYHCNAPCAAVALLRNLPERGDSPYLLYLWGHEGVGKSHLLHATCHTQEQRGNRSCYLSLKTLSRQASGHTLLEASPDCRLIALDDLDAVVSDRQWEEALFHLFNQARDNGQPMVVSGTSSPADLDITLPDLRSRLAEAVVEHLPPLSEEEKWAVLRQRAAQRGIQISDEVVHFLMNRTARDFNTLFRLLDQLDHQTLVEQRRITIPFVKQLLGL